ncbi:MAG: hypothetical protein Q9197_000687 [Variospora fuerteventurae]
MVLLMLLRRAFQRRLAFGHGFAPRVGSRRPFSSKPNDSVGPNFLRRTGSGIERYNSRLPKFLRREYKWFSGSVERAGGYLRKKGWLGEKGETRRHKWWGFGEIGVRTAAE